MTQDHPITPPPELVEQWYEDGPGDQRELVEYVATQAARWGADQELEACKEWLLIAYTNSRRALALQEARRPKPPSLKEQALETLRSMQIGPCWINGVNTNAELMSKYDILRRALEALDG